MGELRIRIDKNLAAEDSEIRALMFCVQDLADAIDIMREKLDYRGKE